MGLGPVVYGRSLKLFVQGSVSNIQKCLIHPAKHGLHKHLSYKYEKQQMWLYMKIWILGGRGEVEGRVTLLRPAVLNGNDHRSMLAGHVTLGLHSFHQHFSRLGLGSAAIHNPACLLLSIRSYMKRWKSFFIPCIFLFYTWSPSYLHDWHSSH